MPTVRKRLEALPPLSKKRMKELKSMPDSAIDLSDIPELDEAFWKNAEIHAPSENKEAVSLRLEAEVLDWFKSQGRGHTTRMATVLRYFYDHHHKDAPVPR